MKNLKQIKLLSIIDSLELEKGGPSHSLIDLAIANQKNGIQHDILFLGKRIKNIQKIKINIISLDNRILKFGFSLKLIFWLLKNRKNYDLFIIHGLWQFITLVSRFLLRGKYLVFTHGMLDPYFGTENFKTLKKKIYWILFEKKNLLKAKFVLSNSNKEFRQFKKTFVNTNGIKFKNVNYGIFPKSLDFKICKEKFLKKFPFVENKKTILFMNRIDPKKGCDLLIKSFAKIKNKRNHLLLIAGDTNSKYGKKMIKLKNELKQNNHIYFLNFLKDQIKWGAYEYSNFSILPSHGENFGVSVVESLFTKTPIICSKKVGISNYIKKYKAGMVINNNNEQSIISNLEKSFLLNKEKNKKLKENSFKCFNENFNYSNNHEFSDWIKKIL